jgi:Domain of Unknown Function (DUF1080)
MKTTRLASTLAILIAGCAVPSFAGNVAGPVWEMPPNTDGFTNTPIVPGTEWHVHDPNRPLPPVVVPGTFSTQEKPGLAPSDAIVLFDGSDLSAWQNPKGEPAKWKIENNVLIESPQGDIMTHQQFEDIQLHLEFSAPLPVKGDSQGRGNSGIYFMGKYEVQILDSYKNPTYADGGVGALYGQHPPQATVPRPPGEWQMYDIVFHPPRFEGDTLKSPAYATVFLNGVLIQDHQSYNGPSGWKQVGHYSPQPPTGPIELQDHHNATRFRNIWVRELKAQ